MNEFEKWYEEFTGVSIGYAEKTGMNSDVLKAAFKAGMFAAEEIAKSAVKVTGCADYDWNREIGALDASEAIKAKADEL